MLRLHVFRFKRAIPSPPRKLITCYLHPPEETIDRENLVPLKHCLWTGVLICCSFRSRHSPRAALPRTQDGTCVINVPLTDLLVDGDAGQVHSWRSPIKM